MVGISHDSVAVEFEQAGEDYCPSAVTRSGYVEARSAVFEVVNPLYACYMGRTLPPPSQLLLLNLLSFVHQNIVRLPDFVLLLGSLMHLSSLFAAARRKTLDGATRWFLAAG